MYWVFPLFQSLINLSPNQRKDIIETTMKETGTVGRVAPYSLKEFSHEYFRYLEVFFHQQVSETALTAALPALFPGSPLRM